MPVARPRPCREPGCPALVVGGGYCDAHRPVEQQREQERDRNRASAAKRGYSSRWRKARATFLARSPLCAACSTDERPVAASDVDHKIPPRLREALDSGDAEAIARAQALFWDTSNWQGLCGPCHSAKTAREDGGFGNRALRRKAEE